MSDDPTADFLAREKAILGRLSPSYPRLELIKQEMTPTYSLQAKHLPLQPVSPTSQILVCSLHAHS
jgi:hypothetical protein